MEDREIASFSVSVTLHMALLMLALLLPQQKPPQNDTPFQVELLEPKKKQTTPTMAINDLEDRLDDIKRKATAMSDKRRRVELETRKRPQTAQLTAPVKSQSQNQVQNQKAMKTEKQESRLDRKTLFNDPSGIAYKNNEDRQPLNLPVGARRAMPQPRVPPYILESLPEGLEIGNISALNTDQHLFFNFNSRLIGGFAPLWVELVGQTVYKWMYTNSFPKVSKSWVTNVEVILTPEGEIIDVQHYRLSGLWPFDEAPVKAFKKLKQVPNPPREMVGDDGYIRLKFQTEVHWRPRPPGGLDLSRGN